LGRHRRRIPLRRPAELVSVLMCLLRPVRLVFYVAAQSHIRAAFGRK